MVQNGVPGMVQSPPQEGPYSAIKPHCLSGGNSGQKKTTPGGSFIDRMRNVLQNTAAAGYAAEKPPSSSAKRSTGSSSGWGDTPDTAEMEYITQLEREALRQRLENATELAAAALDNANGDQAAPASAGPRQLTFSPLMNEPLINDGISTRPGSGRLRSTQRRQLSHLGRTSLACAAAAAEIRSLPATLPPQVGGEGGVQNAHESSVVDGLQIGAVRPRGAVLIEAEEGIKRQKVEGVGIENKKGTESINYLKVSGAFNDVLDSSDDEDPTIDAAAANAITAAATATTTASAPPLDLRAYLSPAVAEAILRIGGPEKLYQWQAECLCRPGVLQGRNIVYCAPTSGGKSLVADIIFLRRFVETGRPGLLVLPFISLCNEKKAYWDNVLQSLDREAREYYGPTSTSAPISHRTGIIVATLEKANHLITHLLEENALSMLSCVIIDELHMVGDQHRGYQLELMLTKLRFAGAAAFDVQDEEENEATAGGGLVKQQAKEDQWAPTMMGLQEGTQIIGMSATLPNVNIVAKWLGAELFTTEFRPVPLWQFLKVGNLIKDENGAVVRTIPESTSSSRFNLPPKDVQAKDPDHVAFLTQETVDEGFSVLVFCATRSASEATAVLLSQLVEIPERFIPIKQDVLAFVATKYGLRQVHRASIVTELERLRSSHGRKLAALVARGVGYHHAGMEPDDKELIELAFKCGAISVLCATSSLAAGVNLPARRVIFRHPYIGRASNYLDAANYCQMRGRAGRAGIDTQGESFLLVLQKSTEKMLEALLHADPAPVESCLTQEKCGMKRAMLEVVASGAVMTPTDVDRYIRCTLLAATSKYEVVMEATKEALKWLGDKDRQFIYWEKKTETFQPTYFGKAALGSGLPPELCIGIRADIARARQSFVLTTELHLAYLCVPATEDKGINYQWQKFALLLKNLQPTEKIVADKVGINMGYVLQKSRSFDTYIGASSTNSTKPSSSSNTSQQESNTTGNAKASQQQQREELAAAMSEQDRICQRFGTALLLSDILQEMSSEEIFKKYGLDRAVVLGLRDRACRYAGMLAVFCERLGWHDVELLVSKFQARVLYGVRPEVLCLMEIDHVQAATARMLYKAGLRTPEAVAAVPDVQRVVTALAASRGEMNELAKEAVSQQARRIIRNAKKLLESRAKKLKVDAAEALQLVETLNLENVADIQLGNGNGINFVGIENGGERSMITFDTVQQQQQQQQQQDQQQHAYEVGQVVRAPPPPQGHAARAPLPIPLNTTANTNTNSYAGTTPSLPPSLSLSLTPDVWEFGRTSGLIMLSTIAHVQALKQVLGEGRYTAFAFQFDILQQKQVGNSTNNSSFSGWSAMPGIPSAAVVARPATSAGVVGAGAGATAGRGVSSGQQQNQQQQNCFGGISLSWRENQAFYIPLTQGNNPQLPLADLVFELAELLNDGRFEKITFNLKGQLTALQRASIDVALPELSTLGSNIAAPVVDVRIAAFLLHDEDDKLSDGGMAPSYVGAASAGGGQQYQGSKKASSYYHTAETLCSTLLDPIRVAAMTSCLPVLQQSGRFMVAAAPVGVPGGINSKVTAGNTVAASTSITAGRNVILLNACYPPLRKELQLKELFNLFFNIEMPLVPILAQMEVAGIGADPEFLKKEAPVLRHRLTELENLAERCLKFSSESSLLKTTTTTINSTVGNVLSRKPLNLNSPDECADALYTRLGLAPPPSAQRLVSGAWSTRSENLEELAAAYPGCPLPGIISEYRTISKLLEMCVELIHFCTDISGDGNGKAGGDESLKVMPRIHATVNQTAAVTGRLSMDAPNLQTVPNPFAFFIPSSGGDGNAAYNAERMPYVCTLRRGIIPPPGMVFLSADYKNLELRMMAHLSRDPLLVAMCKDVNIDPFKQLAARWLGKTSIDTVTPEDRARAKNLAYALIYGMGASRTAMELGLRGPGVEKEAENLKKSFLDAFPVLQRWINYIKSTVVAANNNSINTGNALVSPGEVRTLFNRLRRFGAKSILSNKSGNSNGGIGVQQQQYGSSNGNIGNKALNTITQGSAADVTKLGMLAVAHTVNKLNNAGERSNASIVARLVLSIHDEFLLEVDARYVDRVAREVRAAMEGAVLGLLVPLPVKLSIGKSSWGDMEELHVL